MKKYILLSCSSLLLLAGLPPAFAGEVYPGAHPSSVAAYLAANNVDIDALFENGPGAFLEMTLREGEVVLLRWDEDAIGVPRPDLEDLLSFTTPVTQIAAGRAARREEARQRRQAAKPANLKAAENKAILFLRSEGAVAAGASSVTQEQLAAMFAAWDALPGAQADAKARAYERVMAPVRALGGSETDLFFHP